MSSSRPRCTSEPGAAPYRGGEPVPAAQELFTYQLGLDERSLHGGPGHHRKGQLPVAEKDIDDFVRRGRRGGVKNRP